MSLELILWAAYCTVFGNWVSAIDRAVERALVLCGGLALLVTALSAGFGEDVDSPSLDLGRNRSH